MPRHALALAQKVESMESKESKESKESRDAGTGPPNAQQSGLGGGYSLERVRRAIQQLKVLGFDDKSELHEVGVCNLLFAAVGEPQQMAGVSLVAPRIFPKRPHPRKKVSFSDSLDDVRNRVTLDKWKLYLDTCATYHSAYVKWLMSLPIRRGPVHPWRASIRQ